MAIIEFNEGAENNRVDNCTFNTIEGQVVIKFSKGSKNNEVTNSQFNIVRSQTEELFSLIQNSNLASEEKCHLRQEILEYFSPMAPGELNARQKIIESLQYVGDKALDFFLQLIAAGVTMGIR